MVARGSEPRQRTARNSGAPCRDHPRMRVFGNGGIDSALRLVHAAEHEMGAGKRGIEIERLGSVFDCLRVVPDPVATLRRLRADEEIEWIEVERVAEFPERGRSIQLGAGDDGGGQMGPG